MPVQTQEAATFAREYHHILLGNHNWSMPSSPSRDYLFAWCYMRSLHTKWHYIPCFPPPLCKQRSDQILEAVGTQLFSEYSQFAHKPACIDKGGEI